MKNLALFLLIMLILVVGITPYGDGYLVKREFMKQIHRTQAVLDSQHSKVTLQVTKYKIGWLKSNVTVSLIVPNPKPTENEQAEMVEFPIDFVIQHGPVILIDNKPVIALSYLKGDIHLPEALKNIIPNGENIYLTVTSLMSIDRKSSISNFSIPAINFGSQFKWDGLTGNSTVYMEGYKVIDLKSSVVIGRLSGDFSAIGANYNVDPITTDIVIVNTDDNNASTTVTTKSGAMNLMMGGKSAAQLKSFNMSGSNIIKDGIYNSQFDMMFSNIDSPLLAQISISSIPSIKYYANISNLNYTSVENLAVIMQGLEKQYPRADKEKKDFSEADIKTIQDAFFKILTPKSSLETTLNIDTDIGKSSMLIHISLNNTPKSLSDLSSMTDAKLEVRASKQLVDAIMKSYMTYVMLSQKINTEAQVVPAPVEAPGNGKNIFFQGVADMVSDKSLTPDQSITVMGIADLHPATEADLDSALTKLALPKETTDKIKAAYKSQYMPQAVTPVAAASAEPDMHDPAIVAKSMIDDLMKQGIMINDGDSYSISFAKTGNDMKLNGSTDNPLLGLISMLVAGGGDMRATGANPTINSMNSPIDHTPQAYYAEIVSATSPYRVAVAECMQTMNTLIGCNAGTNRIPAALGATGAIASLEVTNGVITVTPAAQNGIVATDTYVLTPTMTPSGNITWAASGGGVAKGYAVEGISSGSNGIFISSDSQSPVNELIKLTQGIAFAAESLTMKHGNLNNSDFTDANIAALMPNANLKTSWGSAASISNQTETSYTVTFSKIPANVCKELQQRLSANRKYILNNKCDSAEPADFSYKFDILK